MWRHTLQILDNRCDLLADAGILENLGELIAQRFDTAGSQVLIVTDDKVSPLYLQPVEQSLKRAGFIVATHEVPAGESSKSLESVATLYKALANLKIGRDAIILALGGGVVSDLAGFVSATWKRGTHFVICPTTLEAAIDAAIGGKTAVNLPAGKNLVGAFHTPGLVAIDPLCLKTLDPRDVRAGLAESIKHALIADEAFFDWHVKNAQAILTLDESVLTELITRNIEIKSSFVAKDPFEQTGDRFFLNLGHTIGHAIELCAKGALRHGECVALGTVAACRLSLKLGLLSAPDVARIEQLFRSLELPTKLEQTYDSADMLHAMAQDKKMRAGQVQFVLLEAIGKPILRSDITETQMITAYESLAN